MLQNSEPNKPEKGLSLLESFHSTEYHVESLPSKNDFNAAIVFIEHNGNCSIRLLTIQLWCHDEDVITSFQEDFIFEEHLVWNFKEHPGFPILDFKRANFPLHCTTFPTFVAEINASMFGSNCEYQSRTGANLRVCVCVCDVMWCDYLIILFKRSNFIAYLMYWKPLVTTYSETRVPTATPKFRADIARQCSISETSFILPTTLILVFNYK